MERGLSENGSKCASRILNTCQRLDRMVQDIVDFTRGRFGEPMPLNRAPTDLRRILHNIIDEIQCANPELAIDLAAIENLNGEWDAERLSQLISNLVVNAIQHAKAKQVTIRATNEDDHVLIEVHNEGPPIPRHLMTTIFNPLGRERPSERANAGLGLGLFICQEIVKSHNGTIMVTSSQDAGTTFAVRLNGHAE
jgi:signal transduction histidine kinase